MASNAQPGPTKYASLISHGQLAKYSHTLFNGHGWALLDIAAHGWTWLALLDFASHDWTWLALLDFARPGCPWLDLSAYGWTWLSIAGHHHSHC